MSFVAIIEARMTSSRLSVKPLLKMIGKTMSSFKIEKLMLAPLLNCSITGTGTNIIGDIVRSFKTDNFTHGIEYYSDMWKAS